MKKYLYILMILPFGAFAQYTSDANAIFSGNSDLKGFGVYEMKLTQISDATSLFIGASGGVTVNKVFMFGIASYGLATSPEIGALRGTGYRLNGGYGGLLIGFNVFPREVVHISFPIVFGVGKMYLTDPFFFSGSSDSDLTIEQSGFMVVEPSAILEFNVTRFFHLGLGASYRYVQGLSMSSLTDEQLLGWAMNLNLKFGSF